jgi:hypothetical protein
VERPDDVARLIATFLTSDLPPRTQMPNRRAAPPR